MGFSLTDYFSLSLLPHLCQKMEKSNCKTCTTTGVRLSQVTIFSSSELNLRHFFILAGVYIQWIFSLVCFFLLYSSLYSNDLSRLKQSKIQRNKHVIPVNPVFYLFLLSQNSIPYSPSATSVISFQ